MEELGDVKGETRGAGAGSWGICGMWICLAFFISWEVTSSCAFLGKSSTFWKAREQHANTRKPGPFHTRLHGTPRGRAPVSYSPPPSYNFICLLVCLFIEKQGLDISLIIHSFIYLEAFIYLLTYLEAGSYYVALAGLNSICRPNWPQTYTDLSAPIPPPTPPPSS